MFCMTLSLYSNWYLLITISKHLLIVPVYESKTHRSMVNSVDVDVVLFITNIEWSKMLVKELYLISIVLGKSSI